MSQLSFLDGPPPAAPTRPLTALDRDELAPRFLAAEIGSPDYEVLLSALATKDVARPPKDTTCQPTPDSTSSKT